MKAKRKGKVYPSLFSSPSSSFKDPDSVFKLLPLTLLAMAVALPNPDREVLAYLVSRSFENPSSPVMKHPKNKSKNPSSVHRSPAFECGCFDCYTSFWYRWDSSSNREIIHEVIEGFEEHLAHDRSSKRHSKGKRRGKATENMEQEAGMPKSAADEAELGGCGGRGTNRIVDGSGKVVIDAAVEAEEMAEGDDCGNPKSFARKVFPDVVGLLNYRLWNLWNPGT